MSVPLKVGPSLGAQPGQSLDLLRQRPQHPRRPVEPVLRDQSQQEVAARALQLVHALSLCGVLAHVTTHF